LRFFYIGYIFYFENLPALILLSAKFTNLMNTSRRNFIKLGTISAAFIGTNLFAPVSSSAQKRWLADDSLPANLLQDPFLNKTGEDFRQYVGAEFMVLTAAGATSMILSEVTETSGSVKSSKGSGRSRGRSGTQNFVLSFQLPTGGLPQETYRLWHSDFGQFDLFLVPGKRGDFFLLHAVINRR